MWTDFFASILGLLAFPPLTAAAVMGQIIMVQGRLVKIDKEYRAKGLDFIAITLDDLADINTAVPKFLRTMKATMPVYLLNVADPEPAINAVDREWGGALPATFLYNDQGQVVYKHFGRVKADELRTAIEKVMSNE